MAEVKMVSEIELVPMEKIEPYEWNPKTHPPEQVDTIAASILEYGFNNPVLLHDTGEKKFPLVAGHGRHLAAKLLGLAAIPSIKIKHLTAAQALGFLLMDNKAAESAWDPEKLKKVMQELETMSFDLANTGFNEQEISQLLESMDVVMHEGAEKSDSGTLRKPSKHLIIGVNDFLIVVENETDTAAIKKFCDLVNNNPEKKDVATTRIKNSILGIVHEFLSV